MVHDYIIFCFGFFEGIELDLERFFHDFKFDYISGKNFLIGTFKSTCEINEITDHLGTKRNFFIFALSEGLFGYHLKDENFSKKLFGLSKLEHTKYNLNDILDKMNSSGINSLTLDEKKYLDSLH